MTPEVILTILFALIGVISFCYLVYRSTKNYYREISTKLDNPMIKLEAPPPPPPPQVNVNMRPVEDLLKGLPNKILHSIQSSVNTKKGALGELIGYIELEAEYDRIVPLGNIVDFMCLKFPSEGDTQGRIDFVDIKTGKSSRLSKDQRLLQQLIKDKKINFVKVTVNTQTSETISSTN